MRSARLAPSQKRKLKKQWKEAKRNVKEMRKRANDGKDVLPEIEKSVYQAFVDWMDEYTDRCKCLGDFSF